jgi:hypothetical protein
MKLNVYSIHDKAATAFTQPFFMHNDGLAIRAFQDNVNAKDENNISKHPEQFSLFKLGEYDDATGVITPLPSPDFISGGLELVNPTPENDILKEIKALKGYLTEMPKLKEIVNS